LLDVALVLYSVCAVAGMYAINPVLDNALNGGASLTRSWLLLTLVMHLSQRPEHQRWSRNSDATAALRLNPVQSTRSAVDDSARQIAGRRMGIPRRAHGRFHQMTGAVSQSPAVPVPVPPGLFFQTKKAIGGDLVCNDLLIVDQHRGGQVRGPGW